MQLAPSTALPQLADLKKNQQKIWLVREVFLNRFRLQAKEISILEDPELQTMASVLSSFQPSVSSSFQPYRTDTQSNKLYLFFWHTYSPVMYSLYEIDVPNPLPPPPTKDAQDEQIINPNHLAPILQLKTGEYPGNMCCVSLGSKLYFMGGEYDIDYPCIDEDVKIKFKNVKRDFFPRDVYIFDPTTPSLLLHGAAMNSGKSWPLAFVADEKIYVLGSNFTTDIFDISWRKDLELKSLSLFEVYHPKDDNWTILPNPPIGNVETRWVGHAVERRKVFFIAWQRGKECLYCFDLDRGQWTKHITLPSHLRNVSGRIEVIEGTLYGCYHNTVAAIAPAAKEEEEEEEEEGEEEEEEEEEEDEGEEREQEMEEGEEEEWEELEEEDELNIQQQQQEDEMGARFKNYRLHVVSREMGMNAIFNVPQQLQSSSSLLYLGNRCFCYVMTGMPPHPKYGSDHAIEDDKVRVISIVIFRALGETYKEDAIRLFRAKFLHSAHYAVKTSFPNEGVIHGCFSLGWKYRTARHKPESSSEVTLEKKFTSIEEAKSADIKTSFGIAEAPRLQMELQKRPHEQLEKYRTARHKPESSSEVTSEKKFTSIEEAKSADIKTIFGITEAPRLQLELQKRLHEQLVIQKKLQLQIERQGQYLQEMFETHKKIEDGKSKTSTSALDDPSVPLSNAVADVKAETLKLDQPKAGIGASNANPIPEECFWDISQEQRAHEPGDGESNASQTKRARTDQTVDIID